MLDINISSGDEVQMSYRRLFSVFCLGLLVCCLLCGRVEAEKRNIRGEKEMLKIALLHLNFIENRAEVNLAKLKKGIRFAAEHGAKFIVTPEMAVQGYHFMRFGRADSVADNVEEQISDVMELAREYKLHIFLGTAVLDRVGGKPTNSMLVINPKGKIIGRHDKLTIHSLSELWAEAGKGNHVADCGGLKVGLLVCADAWFDKNAAELKELGAEAVVISAAWPPGFGGPPENAWARCSKASGMLPVIVCNQTGHDGYLNCNIAMSAVLTAGELRLSYSSPDEAVLMTDIDFSTGKLSGDSFEVYRFNTF